MSLFSSRMELAKWAHLLMRFGFCFYVLAFPIGNSTREIGAVITVIGLGVYYLLNWKDSNLSRLPVRWFYFLFLAWLGFKCLHSLSPHSGLYVLSHNAHKGFALLLAGIEFVRRPRDIGLLAGLFALMGFYEGLDGVWQYYTGHDLIRNTPIYYGIRLTGSLDTPRVGNLMSMVIPASLAFIFLVGEQWSALRKAVTAALLCAPALFLLAFSYTRSGWIGLGAALTILIWLVSGGTLRSFFVGAITIGLSYVAFCYFEPLGRPDAEVSLMELATGDVRWKLWSIALDVWRAAPALGHGINTFSTALGKMGIVPPPPLIPNVPHPHNIYLQFLTETGIVGFIIFALFVGSFLSYALRDMLAGLHGTLSTNCWPRKTWQAVGCFAAAYMGYLVTAAGAHSFYRSWWLGIAMSILGIVVGAAVASRRGPGGNL